MYCCLNWNQVITGYPRYESSKSTKQLSGERTRPENYWACAYVPIWLVNGFVSSLIIYMKKFLHSDWLRAVQFFSLKQCRKELIQCKKRKQTKHSDWSMIRETHRRPTKSFVFKSCARPGWRNWWQNFSLIAFLLLNHLEIFSHILLIRNHMICLVQFGINKHLQVFQRSQIALALRARAILLVFVTPTSLIYSKLHSKSCDYLYKWNEMLVFDMRKKLGYTERKPLGTKKRTNKLNSQNLWHRGPTRTQATIVKNKRFHYNANPTHLNKEWYSTHKTRTFEQNVIPQKMLVPD